MALLHVVPDFAASPDEEPTHPGDCDTPPHAPEHHVIHRIVCPHHTIPWLKVIAVCAVVTVGVSLALRGLFH